MPRRNKSRGRGYGGGGSADDSHNIARELVRLVEMQPNRPGPHGPPAPPTLDFYLRRWERPNV